MTKLTKYISSHKLTQSQGWELTKELTSNTLSS